MENQAPVFSNFLSIGSIVIASGGTCGNILALSCLWKLKRIGPSTENSEKLLAALNMIDLYQSVVVLPYHVYSYWVGKNSDWANFLYSYLTSIGFWFSSFVVALIALNRFIKISKLSRYHLIMSRTKMNLTICIGFIFTLITPLVYFVSPLVMGGIHVFVITVTLVMLPSFYLLIKQVMLQSKRRVRGVNNVGGSLMESRVNRNVLILIMVYFVCGLDMFFATLSYLFDAYNAIHMRVAILLMATNSTINPVIYVLRDPALRRTLRSLFKSEKTGVANESNVVYNTQSVNRNNSRSVKLRIHEEGKTVSSFSRHKKKTITATSI